MRALYPGSFDPPHFGHLDLIHRAAAQVDELVVGVAVNPDKRPLLSGEQRVALLAAACVGLPNVRVASYSGTTVVFARSQGLTVLVRGLRNGTDLDAEAGLAEVNRANGFDSLFLLSAATHSHLSSRLVKQVAATGLPLDTLVPPAVAAVLRTVSRTSSTRT
jgi:pantetheine-phosphate adenylyltransferase